ncbi:response regulator [Candidatus Kaiserbacteria bacterium]|nr:response regulator [Candidatus Kaiserbacteria bacterium]
MSQKILIIEDDALLSETIAKKLQLAGFNTIIERDGAIGFQMVQQRHPSLVLLDIDVPSKNGYEILEARRNDPVLSRIPFVVMSNSGQPVEISRLISLGATTYVIKVDLDPEEVLAKVKLALSSPPMPPKQAMPTVPAAPTEAPPRAQSSGLAGKRILLVEDDIFLSNLLTAKLGKTGCVSTQAKDGEECVEIISRGDTPLDVILLDLTLPGMSGFDVIPHIRGSERFKSTPIIVLSNLSQDSDISRAKSLGVNKYLVKAERDPDEIIAEIATAI